jgi:hypothetical protein
MDVSPGEFVQSEIISSIQAKARHKSSGTQKKRVAAGATWFASAFTATPCIDGAGPERRVGGLVHLGHFQSFLSGHPAFTHS